MTMVSISPVLAKDMNDAAREFLREDLRNRHFRSISLVVYTSAGTVTSPVDLTEAEADNLLHGKTVDGVPLVPSSPNDIAAWRLSFDGSAHLNFLYAVGSERTSFRIKAAQARASSEILAELAGCVLGLKWNRGCTGELLDIRREAAPPFSRDATEIVRAHPIADDLLHCAFVICDSEVSLDQSPHLNTTAFLLNRGKIQNGGVYTLLNPEAMERIRLPLSESYAGALDFLIEGAIGPFHRVANVGELRIVGIPQEVVRRFFWGPDLDCQQPSQAHHGTPSRKQLSAKWRAQATSLGWGPKEAAVFLSQLRREQCWRDLRTVCIYGARNAARTLRDVMAPLSRLITRGKTTHQNAEERPQERDNYHRRSRSR